MKKIEILQFLRACGALSVFLSHFLGDYSIAQNRMGGQLGVAIFFVISGYLLVERTDYNQLKGYFVKKYVRLIPLYWLLTCVVATVGMIEPDLLHTGIISMKTVLKSLFLIPDAIPDTAYVQPILPVAWTLYLEVFVYILFYICIRICKDSRKAGFMTSIVLLILHIICSTMKSDNIYLNTYGGMVVLYFAVGMMVSIFDKYIYARKNKTMKYSEAALAMILFLLAEQFYGQVSYVKILFVGIIFMGIVRVMSEWKVPVFFINYGDISYSFYLLHYFIIKFFSRIIVKDDTNIIVCICMFAITFAITYVLSKVSHRLIEIKFGSYLKKVLLH